MEDSGQIIKPVDTSQLKELDPPPEYIEHRQKLWDKCKVDFLNDLERKESAPILVRAKDKDFNEKQVEAKSWKTSPIDVAKEIGTKSWLNSLIISKVDGKLWDLERPLEKDCSVDFLTFDDDEGLLSYSTSFAFNQCYYQFFLHCRQSSILALNCSYYGRSIGEIVRLSSLLRSTDSKWVLL